MRLWMDVQDAGGNKVGVGPLEVISAQTTARLSKAGQWQASLPGLDARAAALLLPQRTALIYAERGAGVVFVGGGRIDEVTVSINKGDAMLTVTGSDLLGELATRVTPDGLTRDGLATLLARLPPGWTVVPTSGVATPTWAVRYARESVLGALATAAERLNFSFKLEPLANAPRRLSFDFQAYAPSLLLATANARNVESNPDACAITAISEVRSAQTVANRFYVYGAGDGDARFTLAPATMWPSGIAGPRVVYDGGGWPDLYGNIWVCNRAESRIDCTSAQAADGVIEAAMQFTDIAPISNNTLDVQAAANYLLEAAVAAGVQRIAPQRTYSLAVTGVRRGVLPGDKINVECVRWVDGARPIDIRGTFNVLEVTTSYDKDGLRADAMTVATSTAWPQTEATVIAATIAQVQATSGHPQMAASVDTVSYREPFDDEHTAQLPFWLGNEVAAVHQVLLRYRVDALRSPVQGTTVTGTVNTPAHTHVVPNHRHEITIVNQGSLPHPVGMGVTGGSGYYLSSMYGFDLNVLTSASSGQVTIPNSGGTSDVVVNLSSALVYGIYDDPSPYGAGDVEWLLDGAAVGGAPVSVGGGWYALDVTAQVADPLTNRPRRAVFALTCRVPAYRQQGRRGQVTAQVMLRTVVQPVKAAG